MAARAEAPSVPAPSDREEKAHETVDAAARKMNARNEVRAFMTIVTENRLKYLSR